MKSKPLEAILTIEWSSHVTMPVFVIEADGTLLYYNEPAEALLGIQFEDTGPVPQQDWAERWTPAAPDGTPLEPHELPIVVALTEGRPAHSTLSIEATGGQRRHLEITAVPLIGSGGVTLGAAAIFWEDEDR